MSQNKKSNAERVNNALRQQHTRKLSDIEQEAADFFAHDEGDSVRERYAYQTASKDALSRG